MTDSPFTPQQKADLIRLAVAMRVGAAQRPQARGVLFRKVWDDESETKYIFSCALGAAWEGTHPEFDAERWLMDIAQKDDEPVGLNAVNAYFGHPDRMAYPDPFTRTPSFVDSIIIDMNDRRGWKREEIADWLLKIAE